MSSKKKTPAPENPEEIKAETPAEETAAPAEEPVPEKAEESAEEMLRKELAAEKDKYLRLAAEYDNFRRRSAQERDRIYADVKADTITRLLPVYDNLERALQQETADAAFRKGIEMTMTQLTDCFRKLGVTAIEALGQTFDPALHNAVMHIEDDTKGEGEIVAEFQKGFRLGDKVIRFSMVQVAN